MKFTWEPCFGYGLHILNTYPHHTRLFSNGALNERSVDSNWRVVAAKEHYYYYFFLSLVFSLDIIFSSFLFFLAMIG